MTQSRRAFLAGSCAGAAAVLAGCTGGAATDATLSAENQSGEGQTLTVDEVRADVEYYVALRYDGEESTTEPFDAGATQEDLEVDLQPELRDGQPVEVAVLATDGDAELSSTEVEYQVDLDGTLAADDQRGGGRTLAIGEASANADYYVALAYGDQSLTTESFDADSTQTDLAVPLSPEIEESTTIDVTLHSDATDEVLASETVSYDVVATLTIGPQSGDGEAIRLQEVGADDDFYVEVQYDGETVSTPSLSGGAPRQNLPIDLEPGVDHTMYLEVAVYSEADDELLVADAVQYKYRGAILAVSDQSGDGETLTVEEAKADVSYYVEARYDGETATTRRQFAGTEQVDFALDLEPPLRQTTTVEVALRADRDDDLLFSKEIEYTVE